MNPTEPVSAIARTDVAPSPSLLRRFQAANRTRRELRLAAKPFALFLTIFFWLAQGDWEMAKRLGPDEDSSVVEDFIALALIVATGSILIPYALVRTLYRGASRICSRFWYGE